MATEATDGSSASAASPASTAPSASPPLPPIRSTSSSPPPRQEISGLLTIVLTTSPTPSAPSTDLVAAVLASFRAHCPALLSCSVIVVFDTYDHIGPQLRLKKGWVTPVEAANYDAYKANVKQLVQETWTNDRRETAVEKTVETETEQGFAEYGSPMIADNAVPFTMTKTAGGRISFVEPTQRLGFGLAVRTAVRAATTPYVWVQQHDWTLSADIPLAAMLDAMRTAEQAVEDGDGGLADVLGEDSTPAMELYDMSESDPPTPSTSTPGTPSSYPIPEHTSALDPSLPVAIRYICLPSVRMLRYAGSAHALGFPTLRALTSAFKRDVPTTSSASSASTVSPDLSVLASGSSDTTGDAASSTASSAVSSAFGYGHSSGYSSGHSLPLTPLFFWHDKTHIAHREHYLRRVFASRLALGRGDFIEDHIGQRARAQMKRDPAAWHRWACWLYYPDGGNQLCLRHLQGRTWRGEQVEQAIRDEHVARNAVRNRSAASAAAAAAMAAAEKIQQQKNGETKKAADSEGETRGETDPSWGGLPFGSDED